MAIRSIAQLKAWFKQGKYPTAEQFADWFDSYFHKKEDKIPISAVEQLPQQLNNKYDRVDGEELERKHDVLQDDLDTYKSAAKKEFDNIHLDLKELGTKDEGICESIDAIHQDVAGLQTTDEEINTEIVAMHATDAALRASLTGAHNDINTIRDMLKGGATLAEAKAALVALGANYKDLYAVAGTLKTFLQSKDVADSTINTWQEIESFLAGITDSQSLTALLSQLEARITTAYTQAMNDATTTCVRSTSVRTIVVSTDPAAGVGKNDDTLYLIFE